MYLPSVSPVRNEWTIDGDDLPEAGLLARANRQIIGESDPIRAADDLSREIYCILGIPVDSVDMTTAIRRIEAAAADKTTPFLLSTPNFNFLVNSIASAEFRESLLDSDLCPADGMPIVWIARMLGLPIERRVSGSDIFEALTAPDRAARALTVFLFGGAPGVAAAAAGTLNSGPKGVRCVGTLDPGFHSVDEMSHTGIIDSINASSAQFLVASLGAMKGQLWLHRNHRRLKPPVRAHLGAVLNFQAGTVKRAPRVLRTWGLEWLWRITKEPYLWRRYANDGWVLLRLLLTRVLPLAVLTWGHRHTRDRQSPNLLIDAVDQQGAIRIRLKGSATAQHVNKAIYCFREALPAARQKTVTLDLGEVCLIDARFLGLLLMFRKQLKAIGAKLELTGLSRSLKRMFRLHELGFLLNSDRSA